VGTFVIKLARVHIGAVVAAIILLGWSESAAAQTITEYARPTPDSGPLGITAGPDGALWFTEWYKSKIGRIPTSGTFTEYVVPTANSNPLIITVGPGGALWFAESGNNKIGRITTSGTFTEYPLSANSEPYIITAGPDGACGSPSTPAEISGGLLLPRAPARS
jgi:virginiamycin B lyase